MSEHFNQTWLSGCRMSGDKNGVVWQHSHDAFSPCPLRRALGDQEAPTEVLADLREAGKMRTLEQIGWRSGSGLFYTDAQREKYPMVPVVPVYIMREGTDE